MKNEDPSFTELTSKIVSLKKSEFKELPNPTLFSKQYSKTDYEDLLLSYSLAFYQQEQALTKDTTPDIPIQTYQQPEYYQMTSLQANNLLLKQKVAFLQKLTDIHFTDFEFDDLIVPDKFCVKFGNKVYKVQKCQGGFVINKQKWKDIWQFLAKQQ
ncbi:hypothetical protein SS50377_23706 [Spironucleus salmonicida]|uniref:Uncharacterized protein n=1 Tax=Spironucleus salmonicida TaxID=348837 RepID=V6LWT6_9EUKA|nr:hypothetical protein SS50377_23706 [Spironucleus salmonicida]|eukprot:EST48688.1 Hypothetical protein SS50377_11301 [Spironucleus salmonicida]